MAPLGHDALKLLWCIYYQGGDTSENVEPEQPTEAEEPGAVEPDAAPADKPEPAARGATETSLDLSLLRPKYNTRSKSNLKHVLTEYGMPEEVPAAVKTTKKKEKEKKVEKKEILQVGDVITRTINFFLWVLFAQKFFHMHVNLIHSWICHDILYFIFILSQSPQNVNVTEHQRPPTATILRQMLRSWGRNKSIICR